MDCVIAADGGNSKTDLVVADLSGRVLARVADRGTRSHRDGIAATMAELAALSWKGIEQAGVAPSDVRVGAFYLANIDLPDDEQQAAEALAGYHLADELSVHNDVFAVLRAGATRGWGVAVTSGAGMNAVGVSPDGEVARFLSLGDYTGDWGGGHAVGIAGLGAAIRAGDGRGPDTKLRDVIAARFERPDVETVAIAVHRQELSSAELLKLSPVVFQCATDGDEVAIAILQRLADEVATMTCALLNRLRLQGTATEVVLGGGTLQSGNRVLLDAIEQRLARDAPAAVVRVLDVPPVTGPLIDALTLAGAKADAIERLRAEITAS